MTTPNTQVPTRVWGLYEADGTTPIALGDLWHTWICPERKMEPSGYEHHITGEWVDTGLVRQSHCKTTSPTAKLDVCIKCGKQFIYP